MSFIELAPAWAREMYGNIVNQLGAIMAAVEIEQADLDKVAAAVEGLASTVSGLTTPLAPADETALNQAVSDLQAAVQKASPSTPPPTGS